LSFAFAEWTPDVSLNDLPPEFTIDAHFFGRVKPPGPEIEVQQLHRRFAIICIRARNGLGQFRL
jgi:hypothetical protein